MTDKSGSTAKRCGIIRRLSFTREQLARETVTQVARARESLELLGVDQQKRMGGENQSSESPSESNSSTSGFSSGGGAEIPSIPLTSGRTSRPAADSRIPFGSLSVSGRERDMEDAISVRPGFFCPMNHGFPLHYFAVFDGHGGSHVSALCREWMHVLLAAELSAAADGYEDRWKPAVERCFVRMDRLALSSCACGRVGVPPCRCVRSGILSHIVGSTAAVAVVGPTHILVANCGDSRAVLSRGGVVVPLSFDHKPDRPDERARIEAAGGRVIDVDGPRVQGILAMSRAIGDKYLKPVVISDPEIVLIERSFEDECLIIASDGLWDVMSNEFACNVARECLQERSPEEATEDSNSSSLAAEEEPDFQCTITATLLARLALGRKSADNVSVIVVDLRRN